MDRVSHLTKVSYGTNFRVSHLRQDNDQGKGSLFSIILKSNIGLVLYLQFLSSFAFIDWWGVLAWPALIQSG
jgi:hypothetical protein